MFHDDFSEVLLLRFDLIKVYSAHEVGLKDLSLVSKLFRIYKSSLSKIVKCTCSLV